MTLCPAVGALNGFVLVLERTSAMTTWTYKVGLDEDRCPHGSAGVGRAGRWTCILAECLFVEFCDYRFDRHWFCGARGFRSRSSRSTCFGFRSFLLVIGVALLSRGVQSWRRRQERSPAARCGTRVALIGVRKAVNGRAGPLHVRVSLFEQGLLDSLLDQMSAPFLVSRCDYGLIFDRVVRCQVNQLGIRARRGPGPCESERCTSIAYDPPWAYCLWRCRLFLNSWCLRWSR